MVCVCGAKLDSSGRVVRVFVCVNAYVSVCSFFFCCLLIRVSLCFLGWLVVCVYVCLCFQHLAAQFRASVALLHTFS